tara:strand:- start:6733 stop:7227 length:495 start_codon:yes stop_codon:yes gene_type:complete
MTGEMEIIATSVCDEVGISLDQLKSKDRHARITEARKIFAHLGRRLYMYTLRTLGEYINRDHSTMVIAINKCEDWIETDHQFRELYVRCFIKVTQSLNSNGYDNYIMPSKKMMKISQVKLLNKTEHGFKCEGAPADGSEQAQETPRLVGKRVSEPQETGSKEYC